MSETKPQKRLVSKGWILFLSIAVLVLATAVPLFKQQRQDALNLDLAEAVFNMQEDRVKTDLDKGADANTRFVLASEPNRPGTSGLLSQTVRLPVHRNDVLEKLLLLVHGAKATPIANETGDSCLVWVAIDWNSDQHLAIASALLEHGANPNTKVETGDMTPVLYSITNNDPKLTLLLLAHGAQVRQASRFVLISAIAHNDLSLLKSLLDHGADPRQRDPNGKTILQFVREHPLMFDQRMIPLLKQYGAPER